MNMPLRRKVLFLSHVYPTLRGSGTQIRGAAMVRMLAVKHDVYLVIVRRSTHIPGPRDQDMERCCREIRCLGMKDTGVAVPDDSKGAVDTLEAGYVPVPLLDASNRAKTHPVLWFFQDRQLDELFLFTLATFDCIRTCFRGFPRRSLDLDEMPHALESRIADLKRDKLGLTMDAVDQTRLKTWRVLERAVIPTFDRVFVSSDLEAARVRELRGGKGVYVLPNVRPMPSLLPVSPAQKPRVILFVGTLNYYPNQDAVHFFATEIFPLLRGALGDSLLFRVIGFACPPALRALHGNGIEITGYVDDLRPWYGSASLVVVPLRAAGGTRLKILEAFALGRPVVSTTMGAEGLAVTPGHDILLADSAADFAAACRELLDQPELAAKLVAAGRRLVHEQYSDAVLLRRYEEAIADHAPDYTPAGTHP